MEAWQAREARRQQIVERAVGAATRVIMDGSDGSEEETNCLTARAAEKLMTMALNPFHSAMMRKDMIDNHVERKRDETS